MYKYFIKEDLDSEIQEFEHIAPFSQENGFLDNSDSIVIASCKDLHEIWVTDDSDKGLEELKRYYDDVLYKINYTECFLYNTITESIV